MSAQVLYKFEEEIDRMGELHNAITDLIVASELPTSEVLMVLQMLTSDCEENFRSQVRLLEIQRSKEVGSNLEEADISG